MRVNYCPFCGGERIIILLDSGNYFCESCYTEFEADIV